MATPGWIELFVTRLESVGLSYMVTGSVASMIYGEPRLTLDVDVVLDLQIDRAGPLWVAPPEYVIIRKLEFFREGGSEKHLRDVRAMLAADLEVDRDFLAAELRGRGLEPEWLRVSKGA